MTSSGLTQLIQNLTSQFRALRQHKAFLPVTASGTACVAGGMLTYLAMKRYYRRKKWKPATADFDILPLLPEETNSLATNKRIAVISFFDCCESELAAAEAWITARVEQIAAANRWLAGRLVHAPGTGAKSIAVPRSLSKQDLTRLLLKHPENFCPSRSMNLEQLSAQSTKIDLPYGPIAYDNEDVLASRFVFARTSGGFCIFFAMSHIVGDGATFYHIFNQLSASAEVQSLEPRRNMDFGEKLKVKVGMDIQKVAMSLSLMVSFLKGIFFGGTVRGVTGFVDVEGIARAKAEAKQRGNVPFVSTNDILTSAFSNAFGADVCFMAINWRGRIDGLTHNLAGNYESVLLFDGANAGTPDRIRQTLRHPHFHCRDEPMPPLSRALSARYGAITTWVSFSKPINIPGCAEQVHRPIYNVKTMRATVPFDCAIVFRAGAGRVGVFWMTKRAGSARDIFGDMPITDFVVEF